MRMVPQLGTRMAGVGLLVEVSTDIHHMRRCLTLSKGMSDLPTLREGAGEGMEVMVVGRKVAVAARTGKVGAVVGVKGLGKGEEEERQEEEAQG